MAAPSGPKVLSPSALFELVGEVRALQSGNYGMQPPQGLKAKLSEALGADEAWARFSRSGGALGRLLAAQEQELGGPRPDTYDQNQEPMLDIATLLGQGLVMRH